MEKARATCAHLVRYVKLDEEDLDQQILYVSIMSSRDDVSEGLRFMVLEAVSMTGNRIGLTPDDGCDGCNKIRDKLHEIKTREPLEV